MAAKNATVPITAKKSPMRPVNRSGRQCNVDVAGLRINNS